jgi:hypothetical protein
MKWTLPKVASILLHSSEGIGQNSSARGLYSKEPQRTEFLGLEGVGDVSTNIVDVTGATDDMPCTDRFPIDGVN